MNPAPFNFRKRNQPKVRQLMMLGITPTQPEPEPTGIIALDFETHRLRMVMRDGQPWWVLSDVARILGYRDAANARRLLRSRDVYTHSMSTSVGIREVLTVNEPGLYRLIMRSNKPEAERFQDWITDEVLPTIRKTGTYSLRSSRHHQIKRRLNCDNDTAAARIDNIEANKATRAAMTRAGGSVTDIVRFNNAPHEGMFGAPAKELRELLGCSTTPLDRMSALALAINTHSKMIVAQQEKDGLLRGNERVPALKAAARLLVERDLESLGPGCRLGVTDDPRRGKILGVVRQLPGPNVA